MRQNARNEETNKPMLKRAFPEDPGDEPIAAGDCIARARELAPLIEAHAAETEAGRCLAPDVLAALHEARLFRLLMPRSCDGRDSAPAPRSKARRCSSSRIRRWWWSPAGALR